MAGDHSMRVSGPTLTARVETPPRTVESSRPASREGSLSLWMRTPGPQRTRGKTTVVCPLTPPAGSPSSPCVHLLALASCSQAPRPQVPYSSTGNDLNLGLNHGSSKGPHCPFMAESVAVLMRGPFHGDLVQ